MYVIEGDPEKSFFEQNPELRYIPEVAKLIRKYGEEKAGIYMWASYMFEDPRSKIYRIPIDERTELIKESYLSKRLPDFDVNDLSDVRAAYPTMVLTKTQILYKGYADKIDEANVFIRSLNFDTSGDKILHMLEKITKMWPTYEKIADKLQEEEASGSEVRKGIKESLRERRVG